MIKTILLLIFEFMKTGLMAVGGGMACIRFLQDMIARYGWLTEEELANIIAVAESTPGPIAINCATYVGYRQQGFWGALAATLGIILPSFCLIFAISAFLDRFLEITWIAHAFQGIKIAVGILILDAGCRMMKKMQKKLLPRIILVCAFAAMLLINLLSVRFSSIILMLTAGLVSLILFLVRRPAEKGGAGT